MKDCAMGANPMAVSVDPSGKIAYVASVNGGVNGISAYSSRSGVGSQTGFSQRALTSMNLIMNRTVSE